MKHIKLFGQFILERVRTSDPKDDVTINEVGEANIKPYKWKEVDQDSYATYIYFITDSETQYNVEVLSDEYKGIPILNIEFAVKLKNASMASSKIVVNKGEMYKVMSTITDIIKTYLKKFKKVKGITYYPSKKSTEDFGVQRDNLYKAFISKAIPDIKFEPAHSALFGNGVLALLPTNESNVFEADEEDERLHRIRHFKGSVKDLDDWLKSKIGETNPYKDTIMVNGPHQEETDNSIPYQDFQNGNSDLIKNRHGR